MLAGLFCLEKARALFGSGEYTKVQIAEGLEGSDQMIKLTRAKTDVQILADSAAMLMLPGMIIGAGYGGGIHDVGFPVVLMGSAGFYSLVTYLWLRWRSRR